jgi:hypothetical protein
MSVALAMRGEKTWQARHSTPLIFLRHDDLLIVGIAVVAVG